MFTIEFLGTKSFVSIYVFLTKLMPPEDLFCSVAARGVSLVARKKAKELLCKVSFVYVSKIICAKTLLLQKVCFETILATMVDLKSFPSLILQG